MSDTTWVEPKPGDPGTPKDVNRSEDVAWDGNDPEAYSGRPAEEPAEEPSEEPADEPAEEEKAKPAKKAAAKK